MATNLTIPEWTGNRLTNGAFLDYASRSLAAYVAVGLSEISLTDVGMQLTEAIDDLSTAVNRQQAYDETEAVAEADGDRDSLAKALYHAWDYLGGLAPTHPLAPHVRTLRSEMNAYKGVWAHELRKETQELAGLKAALSSEANRAALSALGLDVIAAALWTANDAVSAALDSRLAVERSRAEERAVGSTPELRKAVAALLVKAERRLRHHAVQRQGRDGHQQRRDHRGGIQAHRRPAQVPQGHRPGTRTRTGAPGMIFCARKDTETARLRRADTENLFRVRARRARLRCFPCAEIKGEFEP